MDLEQLFGLHGTDKAEYGPLYCAMFKDIRQRRLKLLEISIGTLIEGVNSSMVGYALPGYAPGGSLRAWRDYFPHSEIYGLDVQADTQFQEERIHTFLCNSTDRDAVAEFIESQNGITFDIAIDDGSHVESDQLETLHNLFPHIRKGGYYVAEDISQNKKLVAEATRLYNDSSVFVNESRTFMAITKGNRAS